MSKIVWREGFNHFRSALLSLTEALDQFTANVPSIIKSGILHRFALTHELACQTMMQYLSSNSSFKAKGHRAVCQQALRIGLFKGTSIDDGLIWMDMIDSRHRFLLTHSDTILQEEFLKVGHRYAPALRQFEQHMTRLMLLESGGTIGGTTGE